jgi:uncharacterized protein with HEPN domain
MQLDPRAWLWDVAEAIRSIESFVAGLNLDAYENSELVHSAVERPGDHVTVWGVINHSLPELREAVRQVLDSRT